MENIVELDNVLEKTKYKRKIGLVLWAQKVKNIPHSAIWQFSYKYLTIFTDAACRLKSGQVYEKRKLI